MVTVLLHIRILNVMSRALLLLLASCLALASAELIRYDNHHVYRVTANTGDQLAVLRHLEGADEKIIFLDAVHYLNRSINVVVAPQQINGFLHTLDSQRISHELLDENVQKLLEGEDVAPRTRAADYNWEQYHELEDTYSWMESLVELYPNQVTLIEAGQSYEGRKILGIHISYRQDRPGIFLEGGLHGREWIAPATVTYIANQLLTSTDPIVKMVARNFDFYIVPHANPDGYVYTHTQDRFWRKNRSPQGECLGVDLNRNWGFHWNEVGASDNPCSDTYAGPEAFSEIETKSLSEYIASLSGKLLMYISYHSYSQMLVFPYGHTGALPKNYDNLERIFDAGVKAISKRHNTKYSGGNMYDVIYPAAGDSMDWVYGEAGVQLAYAFELRPPASSILTFRLPSSQIIPTGEESLDALVAMVTEAVID